MKNIYIMISKTQTGFARCLRRLGGLKYNHAAISLSEDLSDLYAFARTEQYGYLLATLVHETTDRYLVGSAGDVDIQIYKIPVTDEQYDWVQNTINRIMEDDEYMYNLFSVIAYPLFRGFSTYKAYSCIEFVMFILNNLDHIDLSKPLFKYRPDDLTALLENYMHYDGTLMEYVPELTFSDNYFQPLSIRLAQQTAYAFAMITYRSAFAIAKKAGKNVKSLFIGFIGL